MSLFLLTSSIKATWEQYQKVLDEFDVASEGTFSQLVTLKLKVSVFITNPQCK